MINQPINRSLEETIAFAERRHAVLAGNIANMDTPDYQTRDLSVEQFQKSLKDMMKAQKAPRDLQSQSLSPGLLSPGLLGLDPEVQLTDSPTISIQQAVENVRDASSQIVYHDGSDGNLETQVSQIAKNQSMHSMAVALLKSQYKNLQMAIAGTVNV